MSELHRLPRSRRAAVFVIAVVAFLFIRGPAWWDPFDHARLWFPIVFSYALIPLLVALLMLARRAFSLRGFIVDMTEIVAAKFLVTATFMTIVWSLSRPPREPLEEAVRPAGRRAAPPPWTPPVPTPRDPATLGSIRGRVVDAEGVPVERAIAYVSSPLDGFFAVREDVVTIDGTPSGPEPAVSIVQAGEPLLLRSTNDQIHAYRGTTRDGVIAFQQPVLRAADAVPVRLPHASGETRLTCTAHAESRREHPGLLVVLPHPFFARTAADGTFALEGVPEGSREVVILMPDGSSRRTATVSVTGGGVASVGP